MVHNGWLDAKIDIARMERRAITPVIAGAMVSDLALARMAVPARVRLGPDRLEWIPGTDEDATHWWREGEPASGALWAFIKLATEPDGERFVDFARRFGVLALTPQGRPSVSRQVPDAGGPGQLEELWCGFAVNWEPLAAWRVYAAIARAIVHLALALRQSTPVNAKRTIAKAGLDLEMGPSAWKFQITTLGDDRTKRDHIFNLHHRRLSTLVDTLDRPGRDLASQRQWLAFWVTHGWIAESALIPTITWDSDRPQLGLPIGSPPPGIDQLGWAPPSGIDQFVSPPNMLFNILAAHLAAFICSGKPVARCSRCGELHPRKRKPRADQPVYCDACRLAAERQRKREHAARRRAHERTAKS